MEHVTKPLAQSESLSVRHVRDRAVERLPAEPPPRLCFQLFALHVAITRRGFGLQRTDEPLGGGSYLVDRTVERVLVDLGGTVRPAQLADELKRRRADFFLGGRRVEVRQSSNVAAHRIPIVGFEWEVPLQAIVRQALSVRIAIHARRPSTHPASEFRDANRYFARRQL